MIVVGIDIGVTGAVAALRPDGMWDLGDLLTIDTPAGRRIDGRALQTLLRAYVPADEDALVLIEDVRARPVGRHGDVQHGNGIASQGSLMRSRGIVEGVLDCLRLDVKAIQPQNWKRHFGLLKQDKDEARLLALRYWPDCARHLSRKKDCNRADAMLIALFGKETML